MGLPIVGSAWGSPGEGIWLVSFMNYDLGYFDDETCRRALQPPGDRLQFAGLSDIDPIFRDP